MIVFQRQKVVVLFALFTGLAAAVIACQESTTGPGNQDPQAPELIQGLPRSLDPGEVTALEASNRFAFELLAQLAPGHAGGNLFFSPFSASMALGMTLNGAAGNTYEEMKGVLGLQGLSQEDINAHFAGLISLLRDLDPEVTLATANSIWYRAGLQVEQEFLDRVTSSFQAMADGVDFSDPATVQRINSWVSQATEGAISEMMDEVGPELALVLLNGVYFKAPWTWAFDAENTRTGAFTLSDGSTITVPFMEAPVTVEYLSTPTFEVVELPYGGGAFVMTLLVPQPGIEVDPGDLAAGLDPGTWASLMSATGTLQAQVRMPRFHLSWDRTLNQDLQAMGMQEAFDPAAADLTRMVPAGGLWIGEVRQKTRLEVSEEGTVAAALTSVTVLDSSPRVLSVDRPFIVSIRERFSGTILFLGMVRDPSQG